MSLKGNESVHIEVADWEKNHGPVLSSEKKKMTYVCIRHMRKRRTY